jgi:uncharacterized OB-fold protein
MSFPAKDTMRPYRVLPVPDEHTNGFWDAAARGKLAIQRCQTCRRYHHPPVTLCTGCKDPEARLDFEKVSGRGVVYSWYVQHDKNLEGFADKIPYPVVAVELEEQQGLLMVTNLLKCAPDRIRIGLGVEVVFERAGTDMSIPQFQPR